MVWVQAFPTGPTLISQSVQQIQDNWLFLQTNINTDHYFNSGAPNEGHHRFVQSPNQSPDPALAAGMDSVQFSRVQNTLPSWPCFRNSKSVYRGSLSTQGTAGNQPAGSYVLFTFTNANTGGNIAGTFYVYNRGGAFDDIATVNFVYNNAAVKLFLSNRSDTGVFDLIGLGAANEIQVDTNAAATIDWAFSAIPVG